MRNVPQHAGHGKLSLTKLGGSKLGTTRVLQGYVTHCSNVEAPEQIQGLTSSRAFMAAFWAFCAILRLALSAVEALRASRSNLVKPPHFQDMKPYTNAVAQMHCARGALLHRVHASAKILMSTGWYMQSGILQYHCAYSHPSTR